MASSRLNEPIEPMAVGNMAGERHSLARRVLPLVPPRRPHQRGALAG
jgi:hypothetical protein